MIPLSVDSPRSRSVEQEQSMRIAVDPRRRHRQGRHGGSGQGPAGRRRARSAGRSTSSTCRGAPTTTSTPARPCRPNGYQMLREFDAIFVGALGDPRVPDNRHARDILLGTRFELDLYVNYRPVRLLDDRLCPLKDRGRKRRQLRRVPREHRRPLRQRRRPLQGRHRRRGRDPGRDQHLQGRAPDHPPRVRVRAAPAA